MNNFCYFTLNTVFTSEYWPVGGIERVSNIIKSMNQVPGNVALSVCSTRGSNSQIWDFCSYNATLYRVGRLQLEHKLHFTSYTIWTDVLTYFYCFILLHMGRNRFGAWPSIRCIVDTLHYVIQGDRTRRVFKRPGSNITLVAWKVNKNDGPRAYSEDVNTAPVARNRIPTAELLLIIHKYIIIVIVLDRARG